MTAAAIVEASSDHVANTASGIIIPFMICTAATVEFGPRRGFGPGLVGLNWGSLEIEPSDSSIALF